ncbi:uncharacterized protein EI97DRAFT_458191 [Westerdykella ornata]|uniref:Uncharacterized protein n=1 Tax=Westerdykella ornata TaxID=318751 RepID=A0A6A6JKV2_WESOR|nr:uncharacterized protein EI97DRAFT_458191 [Westerdykella ornata]KAF2276865.1 hypothetical protein EI97DRAFT_458191 [Westerdykella ornata]
MGRPQDSSSESDFQPEPDSETSQKQKKPKTTNGAAGSNSHKTTKAVKASLAPAPQPAPVGTQDDACPIDWDLPAFRYLRPYHCEISEMRSPLKPKADYSLTRAAEILNNKYESSKHLTDESWRKRFSAVQVLVYKATGLYWAREYKNELKKIFAPPHCKATRAANGPHGKMDP